MKALAVPFVDKGRDYTGWDCYGVVYRFFMDVRGINLPSYSSDYTDTGDSAESRQELSDLIASKKGRWELVQKPEPMDVVLFTLGGQPIHVGLVIDKKSFLHCERKVGTVVESLNSIAWKKRTEGVYRLCQIR
jgi:cell wall-associated NlpC family hydrolase